MDDLHLKSALQRAQNGDRDAFGYIYDMYAEKLYRFIYFRVGHKEVAEDILSDTFVKSWQKIHQVNSPAAFSGWLYQIAKNNVIDYYRIKKELVPLDDLIDVLEDAINPVDTAELSLQQKKITSAMEQMPSEQRQVLQYRFFEDLSSAEIAFILGKTEGAVRVIQHRAVTKLKELLKPRKNHAA